MIQSKNFKVWFNWELNFGGIFEVDKKKKRLEELMLSMENPAVWGDPNKVQALNKEKVVLERTLKSWDNFSSRLNDAEVLLEMAQEASDESSFQEVLSEVTLLESLGNDLETERLLSGELDSNSCYLSINSGAGGTEACDWAEMLYRMYIRYADRMGYGIQTLDRTDGDGAGLKSATLLVTGPYAYGRLKSENGVHRLVRISPFDSNARRHTSFASVFAWAEVDDDIKIEIRPEDIKVETFRASGAGGQHVNRTDSAVRMYHVPTDTVVQCQSERSQIQNREKALKMLKAKLYEKEVEERNRLKDEMNSQKKANEWGSQIRSYVLHPYQLVKDHRTSHETSQSQNVLDGDIDDFITAFLKASVNGNFKVSTGSD